MNKEAQMKLPPIIIDYIEKLKDKRATRHQKEMVIQTLEHIQRSILTVIEKHKGMR